MTDMVEKLGPKEAAMKIRYLYQQALSITTSYIIEIGRVLTEQKDTMEHGAWGKWLEEEVGFSASTAQNYMKIYKRFGSEQISLFGSTKTEAIGTLPYTKALKLLAVPDEEMDDFLAEHDVDKMSTRELEQAIRERDEANIQLEDTQKELEAAETAAAAEKAEADKLRAELEELQSRPVEVAVEAPSEEMLAEIRAAEEAKFQAEREALQKRAADAEAKAQKQADKVQKLKEQADKAAEQAKAELQKDLDAAAKAQADAEARAAELERKLKLADSDTAVFQVYFQRVQEDCNRMLGLIKKADQAQADKYRAALRSLLGAVGKMIGDGDE